MGDGVELSLEQVEALAEIWEGFSLMDVHGVIKDNCTSLDEMKERLRLHYYQQQGSGKNIHAAEEVITMLREEDEEKRFDLRQLLDETVTSLSDLDSQIKDHLQAEGTVKELVADLTKHAESLANSECPILVAGETSSGKSSLLNLLLGKEILPHSLLSCTSVICKLRYGSRMRATVHAMEGDTVDIALQEDANPMEQLARYIFKVDRESHQQYRAVEIYLPLDILKTGVYIIDSPGFGENADMDKLVLDYISQNEIFAFIYVIKSDNAGGVQEDRLQRILKFIVDQQHSNHVTSFDPRAAVFVCNRWDLVPEKERELIKKDTFVKLSHCWPDLDESQIFCLSTTKAWTNKTVGYISEDYSQLLDGIQRLIPVGLHRKVQHSHRWLDYLLGRVLHHASSYLAKTRISSKELEARHKSTELRLHRVERESGVIMKRLDKQLDKGIRSISKKLSEFLRSEDAHARMSMWALDQLPAVQDEDVWLEIESDIDCVIEKRLALVLREWDEKHKLFHKAQKSLFSAFKEEFLLLESQLTSIEQCIQSDDDMSLSDKTDEDTSRFLSLTENVNQGGEGLFDMNLSTLQKIVLGFAAPVLVPVAIGMLVGAPIFLLWDFKKWRRRSNAQKNLESYMDDPMNFVSRRSQSIMDKVADLEHVSEYVYQQLEPARLYLEAMRTAVPKLVDSNRQLMDDIMQDKRTGQELEERYLRYEDIIPRLQEKLAVYGNLYIREYDLAETQLEYTPPPCEGAGFTRWSRTVGIWTDVKAASLQRGGKTLVVSVKTYSRKVSAVHLMAEEIQFRKIRHPCIAQLVGTVEVSRGVPGFVLDGPLVKARQELFGFRALPRASKGRNVLLERCRQFLEQVGIGLEYIHYKGAIHMELSLDTVMLIANKDLVKLTNLGVPRKADLPEDLDVDTGEFAYLPPEVLRGAIYRTRSDMYGLGVMAWELWSQELAFKTQRKSPLRNFIQTVRPSFLSADENNPFQGLIGGCVNAPPEGRLCSTTWVNEIRKLDLLNKGGGDDEEQ